MSILHHRLYQNDGDFSKLSFKEYTTDLINSIHTTYSNKKVDTEIDIKIENIHLDIDTAIPLGLIINELTTNAYKYALAEGGSLLISITSIQNNEYKLHVKDNGKGMPIQTDFENVNTLGLKLVKILSKQIKGNLSYFYNDGANFVITFIDKSISSEI
jgi:two-component sensor histidine kinase